MFSSFGSASNPYGGRGVNLKRQLFGKKKSISLQSEGLDLHKVKGQHCVETWATHYNNQLQPTTHYNNQDQLANVNKAAAAAAVNTVSSQQQQQQVSSSSSDKLNRVNLITSSPTSSTFLEKVGQSGLVVKEQQQVKELSTSRQQQEPSSSRSEKLAGLLAPFFHQLVVVSTRNHCVASF